MIMSGDRLILPGSLIPDAKAELQRNELHAEVVKLANGIFWQKYSHTERRDTRGIRTLSWGETSPIAVIIEDEEFQMQLIGVNDFSSSGKVTRPDMGGISIRISKSGSNEFAELGRIIHEGSLGIDQIDGGIIRKVGYETYRTIDADQVTLKSLLEILKEYGEAIGYDPSQTHQSQPEVA